MSFKKLSHRFTFTFPDYPKEWYSLIHLYDADTLLFPLYYFHVLFNNSLLKVPRSKDRAFGFVERARLTDSGLKVSIICNKDLKKLKNSQYFSMVKGEIKERLGISNPVIINDVSAVFPQQQSQANSLLAELWRKIVPTFGNSLPFGRFYDPVFGLARMGASFYSPGGRKSEWIQTHYFCSKFGEKISVAPRLPQMDFYLLPTFQELTMNNLNLFPSFQSLDNAADDFHNTFCTAMKIRNGLNFSKFNPPYRGSLSTEKLRECIHSLNPSSADPLVQCFNAFDKGPLRTVVFLLSFNDLKNRRWNPLALTSSQFGLMYTSLKGFYQSPKVLSLYAQQCFGNDSALPLDTWVETFLRWPLRVYPASKRNLQSIFKKANKLGKMERLLWISAQTRKIHSSICDDTLWCLKYDSKGKPRGANPLACNACDVSIRNQCPAYANIAEEKIAFNTHRTTSTGFEIQTSARNNTTSNQRFRLCKGKDIKYGDIHDDFTPVDDPNAFAPYPQKGHRGEPLMVRDFVNIYGFSRTF